MQTNTGINFVRSLYLWCMAAIYLFAFGSLYYQIPGKIHHFNMKMNDHFYEILKVPFRDPHMH